MLRAEMEQFYFSINDRGFLGDTTIAWDQMKCSNLTLVADAALKGGATRNALARIASTGRRAA